VGLFSRFHDRELHVAVGLFLRFERCAAMRSDGEEAAKKVALFLRFRDRDIASRRANE
jgi:hypothetical protein